MQCPKCGTELPDGAKYCHQCGPLNGEIGGMHDSVAMRSPGAGGNYAPVINLSQKGDEKRFCPECEAELTRDNKPLKCMDCGKKFCENCEGFYRSERKKGDKPLCYNCFETNRELLKRKEVKAHIEEEKRKGEENKRKIGQEELAWRQQIIYGLNQAPKAAELRKLVDEAIKNNNQFELKMLLEKYHQRMAPDVFRTAIKALAPQQANELLARLK